MYLDKVYTYTSFNIAIYVKLPAWNDQNGSSFSISLVAASATSAPTIELTV